MTMNFQSRMPINNIEEIMEIQIHLVMLKLLLDESLMRNNIFTQYLPTNSSLITKGKIAASQWEDLTDPNLTQ